jgi:hypothetical protein
MNLIITYLLTTSALIRRKAEEMIQNTLLRFV